MLGGLEISLDKQVTIYSIDTNDLYIGKEIKINKVMNRGYFFRNKLKTRLKKQKDEVEKDKINKRIQSINKRLKALKEELYTQFEINKDIVRELDHTKIGRNKEISIFNSVLTRTLNMKLFEKGNDYVNDEIIVIQTYYFQVLESIIHNGFNFKNEKYICLTASAGQIRTKKIVFIKERLFEQHKASLMCGLTPELINGKNGVNINKYLAYLALCNSATEEWNFDLTKSIVVDDMELNLECEVDFIDDVTFEITRTNKEIPINHTDGCGMMLPSVSKNNFMIRMPWVKGLLVSFPFDKFIKEKNGKPIIKDIYGKERNIIDENIQIIFTKSQFKMWKYYDDWEQYIQLFNKYQCKIGICNEEEDELENKRMSYQMLQTLTDMSQDEINIITKKTNTKINNISRDKKTMLEAFGVNKNRNNMNNFQKSLSVYPELLGDAYTKESLKQIKKKKVKEGKAGKLELDCKYSFVVPDLYAFCEYLFLGEENPQGLLRNKEISFSDYENEIELDCLRSPHLYREHAIRKNIHNEEINEWFITKGMYTSVHDPISKILMFDVDGDKLLIVKDKTIVDVAKRNMVGIVPLYYEMKKADNHQISSNVIYSGLISAYTGGNIGVISNDISKVWNSDNVNIDVIKWLCMVNNFTIDYAKTLYKPQIPNEYKDIMASYKNKKLPQFFVYAKDKELKKVEPSNDSVMNRISRSVINKRMSFKDIGDGDFDYRMLMHNKEMDTSILEISELYTKLDRENARQGVKSVQEGYSGDNVVEYNHIRKEIIDMFISTYTLQEIVDSLVIYLFKEKNSAYKKTFWSSFGDVTYENLIHNLNSREFKSTIPCESCGTRITKKSNRTKYCDECMKEKERIRQLTKWHKNKDRYK